jgi:hypothetical protein
MSGTLGAAIAAIVEQRARIESERKLEAGMISDAVESFCPVKAGERYDYIEGGKNVSMRVLRISLESTPYRSWWSIKGTAILRDGSLGTKPMYANILISTSASPSQVDCGICGGDGYAMDGSQCGACGGTGKR